MKSKLFFWYKILCAYATRGFPLSAVWGDQIIEIGIRNRGLLDYSNLSAYEPCLQEIISSITTPFVFFDVGANVGLMSRVAINNPNFEYGFAVEPSDSFQFLAVNCSRNVSCMEYALSDTILGLSLSRARNAARDTVTSCTEGDVLVLSSSELQNLIPQSSKFFLKVDIEGAENSIDWKLWLRDERMLGGAIEIWNEDLFAYLVGLAKAHGFNASYYNDRFDKVINTFESPCNLVLFKPVCTI